MMGFALVAPRKSPRSRLKPNGFRPRLCQLPPSCGHATWRAYVKDVPIADVAAGRALATGSPGCSATANVAVRRDADSVAHVREHSGAPWRIGSSLPRRAPCHVGRLKVIDRHVPMRASVSLRRPIAPRSQGPWNPGKSDEVLP